MTGSIRHAQIRVGDSPLMIGGESPEYPDYQSPLKRGGSTVHFYLYVDDPDAMFAAAVSAEIGRAHV